jgi:serine/threonine-protein kinase
LTADDDAEVEQLAARLVDGVTIDWQAAESGASTPTERAIVQGLRVLASVAHVHAAGESTWGHLRVLERIGHGGFGDVYRAWDPRLDREVALKLLRRGELAASPAAAIEEGRLLARVRHPNVVIVYGAERRDGCVGLWMELIRGRTLDEIVRRDGVFSASEAALVGAAVCQAVSAVHGAGLVHRDIKAHNVMREDGGRIVLMDFGVGKEVTGDDVRTRDLAGTPVYLAPELLDGAPASASSDIYSIGVLLFRLVANGYPLTGRGLDEIRALHRHGARTRLRDARPSLPGRFIAIVERALAVDPLERYRTAGEMETALLGCLDGRPEGTLDRERPGALRRGAARRLVPVAIAVLLAGSAGSRVASPMREPATPTYSALAVLPFHDTSAPGDAGDLGDALTDALIGELSRIRPLRVVSRTSSMLFKDTPKRVADIGRELNVDVLVEGSMRRVSDRVQLDVRLIEARSDRTVWTGRFEGQLDDMVGLQTSLSGAIAYELRSQLPATARLSRTVDPRAYLAHLRGRAVLSKRTPDDMRRARALFEQAIDLDPTYAPAHAGLADAYSLLGAFGVLPKGQTLPRAKAAAARALELDPALADTHVAFTYVHIDEGDRFAAQKSLERAIELSPNHAGARHWYALILVGDGRFAEAIAEIERAQLLDPLSMIIQSDAGVVYRLAGQVDKAVAQLAQTTSLHPEFAEAHLQLALAYEDQRRFEECYAALARAYALSPQSVPVLEHLAWAAAKTNRRDEAQSLLARLRAFEAAGTVSSSSLAAIHAALGEVDEAFQYIEKGPSDPLAWATQFAAAPQRFPRLEALVHDPRFPDFRRRALALRHPDGWPVQPGRAGTAAKK